MPSDRQENGIWIGLEMPVVKIRIFREEIRDLFLGAVSVVRHRRIRKVCPRSWALSLLPIRPAFPINRLHPDKPCALPRTSALQAKDAFRTWGRVHSASRFTRRPESSADHTRIGRTSSSDPFADPCSAANGRALHRIKIYCEKDQRTGNKRIDERRYAPSAKSVVYHNKQEYAGESARKDVSTTSE